MEKDNWPPEEFCIVCWNKIGRICSDVLIAMGNKDTQRISSHGYCEEHVYDIIRAFERRSLVMQFFDADGKETREHAHELLIKWRGSNAYFL